MFCAGISKNYAVFAACLRKYPIWRKYAAINYPGRVMLP
jgi:hypothetical protein